jgi:geranylgeranyl diphosphate synthase type I
MLDEIAKYREPLVAYLGKELLKNADEYASINFWARDAFLKLHDSAVKGKLVRGSLLLYAMEIAGGTVDDVAYAAAAALEIMHTGLLVHDDIMDEDRLRRGLPTVFAQYESYGEQNGLRKSQLFGISQGISVGDIAFFSAFKMLSSANISSTIIGKFSHEMILVGLAQMDDVFAGHTDEQLSLERVMQTYRYKTARYTFSLPFLIGCELANNPALGLRLSELGEVLGLIFQIKDDELGLYGSDRNIGKPHGSDVREGKQTPYAITLFHRAAEQEREKLRAIFGNHEIGDGEISYVMSLIEKYDVKKTVDGIVDEYTAIAEKMIEGFSDLSFAQETLSKLLAFNLGRKI